MHTQHELTRAPGKFRVGVLKPTRNLPKPYPGPLWDSQPTKVFDPTRNWSSEPKKTFDRWTNEIEAHRIIKYLNSTKNFHFSMSTHHLHQEPLLILSIVNNRKCLNWQNTKKTEVFHLFKEHNFIELGFKWATSSIHHHYVVQSIVTFSVCCDKRWKTLFVDPHPYKKMYTGCCFVLPLFW